MAILTLFGRLQRVPSVVLNEIQRGLFTARANGPENTGSIGLNVDGVGIKQREVVCSLDTPALPDGTPIDTSIDWRDRDIDIRYLIDDRDIRPGTSAFIAGIRGHDSFYTGRGGFWNLGDLSTLSVDPTNGALSLIKDVGYMYIRIKCTLQLGETS